MIGSSMAMNLPGQTLHIHSTNVQYLSTENQLLYVVKTPSSTKLLPISMSIQNIAWVLSRAGSNAYRGFVSISTQTHTILKLVGGLWWQLFFIT